MPVIRYKKTALADRSRGWDGDAERAAADVADLKVMCTWYAGDGGNKGDYKLPHHTARGHKCVLAGVRSALKLLNATHMPEGDRSAVRSHLERHLYEDFGEPRAKENAEAENQRVTLGGDWLEACGRGRNGRRYEVMAITAGEANGLEYPASVLESSLYLWDGANVFVDHPHWLFGGRSFRDLLGVLDEIGWDEGRQGIAARLQVYPGMNSEWFAPMVDQYLADKMAGRATPRVGLSAIVDVKVKGREVVSIDHVVSVDAVFDPARGGEFMRALNARLGANTRFAPTEGGMTVGEETTTRAVTDQVTNDDAPVVAQPRGNTRDAAQASDSEKAPADRREVPDLTPHVAALSRLVVDQRLGQTQLPEELKAMLAQKYGDAAVPADLEGMQEEIEALQAAWAASVASAETPPVRDVGMPRWRVGLDETDRLQAVMNQLCGIEPASEELASIPPVSGIRELYLMLTGDYEFQGVYRKDRVGLANVTTATMTSLVKNAFNKVILDWFNSVDLWWRPVASEENFNSMKDLTLITLGGFGDLPTVAEGAAYTELSWSDTEEVVSFVKKGAYVGVTLEMMDQDETRKFRAIPGKIAIAGYRTLSTLVSNLFTDNAGVGPYWPSSQAVNRLFCTTYGNLLTTALSAAAWDAVVQAMYKQTEATSDKRMGIRPAYCLVPIELEKTALTIFESKGEPGTADNDANVRAGSARVIVVPDWTNAANWAAVADPRLVPGITIGYRFGRAPEVYTAGEETIGSMFTNDEMRIKARFIVAVGVGDYRGLHKSNI